MECPRHSRSHSVPRQLDLDIIIGFFPPPRVCTKIIWMSICRSFATSRFPGPLKCMSGHQHKHQRDKLTFLQEGCRCFPLCAPMTHEDDLNHWSWTPQARPLIDTSSVTPAAQTSSAYGNGTTNILRGARTRSQDIVSSFAPRTGIN